LLQKQNAFLGAKIGKNDKNARFQAWQVRQTLHFCQKCKVSGKAVGETWQKWTKCQVSGKAEG
jgi:hypothetical protein